VKASWIALVQNPGQSGRVTRLLAHRKVGQTQTFLPPFLVSKQYDTLPHRKHHQQSCRSETEGRKRRFKREIKRENTLMREGSKAGKDGNNFFNESD